MSQHLGSQEPYDLAKSIQAWQSGQENIQPGNFINEALKDREVSHLSTSLLSLFKEVILSVRKQSNIPKDVRISLERSCSALILWSDGHGISQGHLNDDFKRSSKLRHALFKNLSHLGRVLTERLIPLANISSDRLYQLRSSVTSCIEDAGDIANEKLCRGSDDSSGDDSSNDDGSTFSDDNFHEIAEDLKIDTCVLSSLDPLIKYPIFDHQEENVAGDYAHSTWKPEKAFVDKIENRFPQIDTSLASLLGKTNLGRYLRCRAYRKALEVINEESAGGIFANSKFRYSGIATSKAPSTIYPETVMSYGHEGQTVRIPPLSEDAKAGLPFSCVACSRTVVITNKYAWKRHVYLDLQPYMCLDVSCAYSITTFDSREKWISHLAFDHEMAPKWDSFKCQLCEEETASGKLAVIRHLSDHLEEISLSALPREVNSNAASENGSEPNDPVSIFEVSPEAYKDIKRTPHRDMERVEFEDAPNLQLKNSLDWYFDRQAYHGNSKPFGNPWHHSVPPNNVTSSFSSTIGGFPVSRNTSSSFDILSQYSDNRSRPGNSLDPLHPDHIPTAFSFPGYSSQFGELGFKPDRSPWDSFQWSGASSSYLEQGGLFATSLERERLSSAGQGAPAPYKYTVPPHSGNAEPLAQLYPPLSSVPFVQDDIRHDSMIGTTVHGMGSDYNHSSAPSRPLGRGRSASKLPLAPMQSFGSKELSPNA